MLRIMIHHHIYLFMSESRRYVLKQAHWQKNELPIKNSSLAGCADVIIVINLAWLLWWFHDVFWEVSNYRFCIICIKNYQCFFHALYLNPWRCQSVKLGNIEPFSNKCHLNHFHVLRDFLLCFYRRNIL